MSGSPVTPASSAPAGRATARPLRAVLDSIGAGTSSVADIADRTGLAPHVVGDAVDHLLRLGRLSAETMAFGCPGGGCGTCASGAGGRPGCGATGPSTERRGPVLVTLRIR